MMLCLRRSQRKTARRFLGKAQLTKYFNRAKARQFLARFFYGMRGKYWINSLHKR